MPLEVFGEVSIRFDSVVKLMEYSMKPIRAEQTSRRQYPVFEAPNARITPSSSSGWLMVLFNNVLRSPSLGSNKIKRKGTYVRPEKMNGLIILTLLIWNTVNTSPQSPIRICTHSALPKINSPHQTAK